ncbi:hypothetical protein C8R44DRAFT_892927 [Mycena epipterygia]|nr:hypothetical protein C8R44DRAFT_892927 [Mycena epipterygia]
MPTRHIVAMLVPAWGHIVGHIYLAMQMLQKDPNLVITMVQHSSAVDQMEAELKTCTYDTARLRIIGLGKRDFVFSPAAIKECFTQLIAGWMETIPKLSEGNEGWPKPQTLHLEYAIGGIVIEPIKQMVGPDCKILIWWCCGLVSMPANLHDYNFVAIAEEIYADPSRREDRSMDDILAAIGQAWNGSDRLSGLIIKSPGMPDMYDYERISYSAGPAKGVIEVLVPAQKLAKMVDGIIVELFIVGLQVHEQCWTDASPAPPTNATVAAFLDTALVQHGPKSVLYISFGSLYFPVATPALVEALLDMLLSLEQPLPFIFALGSKLVALPPRSSCAQTRAGTASCAPSGSSSAQSCSTPPSAGFSRTAAGSNFLFGVRIALARHPCHRVWPTSAEQPVNAALLASGLHPVAIELFQVRTGRQLRPSLRGGPLITGTPEAVAAEFKAVFEAAWGPCRASLRANAVGMAAALRAARKGEVGNEMAVF